jgi:hypothetical protein
VPLTFIYHVSGKAIEIKNIFCSKLITFFDKIVVLGQFGQWAP